MVHIYYGDGKGKTTAAVGLLTRATGAGLRCLFVQFLKGGCESCEREALERLGVVVWRAQHSSKFLFQMQEDEKQTCLDENRTCFEKAAAAMRAGRFDLAVLDEALDAVDTGLLQEEDLLKLVEELPCSAELVLTGHSLHETLCEKADYVSCVTMRKHPYQHGVTARRGIEY